MGAARPATLEHWTVRIDGLVRRRLSLTLEALFASQHLVTLRSDVECPEGIGTIGHEYTGVPLSELLEEAGVARDARYACVHSGAFTAAFALESLDRRTGILAVLKDGRRMDWDDGGPVRLVVAKGACFDTVKWVERITLERDSSSATALSIVRARRGLA